MNANARDATRAMRAMNEEYWHEWQHTRDACFRPGYENGN